MKILLIFDRKFWQILPLVTVSSDNLSTDTLHTSHFIPSVSRFHFVCSCAWSLRRSIKARRWNKHNSNGTADSLLASCQQTCMTHTIAVCTVKNSWWWAEELSETCRMKLRSILILLESCLQTCMTPLLCVQWKTPDDGQRNCPKHVEFHSKNKFEKLVHLVGFSIRNLSRCTVTWMSY